MEIPPTKVYFGSAVVLQALCLNLKRERTYNEYLNCDMQLLHSFVSGVQHTEGCQMYAEVGTEFEGGNVLPNFWTRGT